ncbi:MAG TPA: hypothetical protein PK006_13125, partial [Saprospiraceae bacterium]|nr:hypothetical protein [Saprospiraceae bacterium]
MFELPEFIYYSFYTGRAGSLRKSWKLHDIKLPAFELKQAVTMFLWQYDYVIKKNSPVMPGKEIWRDPSPHRIKHVIRKVISFKLVRSKGKT